MNRKTILLVGVLLVLYIAPLTSNNMLIGPTIIKDFDLSEDGRYWLYDWEYRRIIPLTGSAGAGTNYQVQILIAYQAHMQTDFDDIRFTDNDGETLLDYWLETKVDSGYAIFWVEVTDDLDSNQNIYIYYGNSTVSTISNGTATFNAFFDKDSITGWSLSDIAVSTSGDYLRFYNPTNTDIGMASRFDVSTPADFQMMVRYKQTSLGTKDQFILSPCDASTSHRFAMSIAPKDSSQNAWYYYDGAMKAGGAWTEGTEFIYTIQVDEGDSSNGIDYRRYSTSWSLLDSAVSENFALGSPTDCDGLFLGDAGSDAYVDAYIRWMAFRKCIDTEPEAGALGDEELFSEYVPPDWEVVGEATLIFVVPMSEATAWALNNWYILLGAGLVVFSGLYLVKGGKDEMSIDKGFYVVLAFMFGWALIIGVIIP